MQNKDAICSLLTSPSAMLTVEAQIKAIFSKGKSKNLSHRLTSEKEFQPGAQAQTSELRIKRKHCSQKPQPCKAERTRNSVPTKMETVGKPATLQITTLGWLQLHRSQYIQFPFCPRILCQGFSHFVPLGTV